MPEVWTGASLLGISSQSGSMSLVQLILAVFQTPPVAGSRTLMDHAGFMPRSVCLVLTSRRMNLKVEAASVAIVEGDAGGPVAFQGAASMASEVLLPIPTKA